MAGERVAHPGDLTMLGAVVPTGTSSDIGTNMQCPNDAATAGTRPPASIDGGLIGERAPVMMRYATPRIRCRRASLE